MAERLAGRTAIVTGAAHGIGRAICVGLAREGAAVWACDILGSELEQTRRAVTALGGGRGEAAAAGVAVARCEAAVVDVTEPRQVTTFVERVVAAAGTVDVLVNNAGGVAGQVSRPIEEVDDAAWRQIFAVNLDAAFHFTRAAAPAMKTRRRGSIVNISSGAGRSYSLTGIQAYASAKAGVIGLTRQTARELGAFNIRVNSVAPGFVLSNPASEAQWQAMGPEGQRAVIESVALRRLGRPEDIAGVVVFLASDDAAYVSGQTIGVDGGRWMLG
jgi:3-oxoacyl-[acyl-carrier protein] reductase